MLDRFDIEAKARDWEELYEEVCGKG